MVYIYKKIIGNKEYYYLRASVKKKNKIVTKDILYLGNNLNSIKSKINELPKKYTDEIRKTYKTINKFLELNHFLEKIRDSKLKQEEFLSKELLENIEACRLHWNNVFNKLDSKTKNETLKNFIIDFAFNTTSIEGNTISLKQAQNLLLNNLTPANKTLREIYDLQNTEKVFLDLLHKKNLNHELICEIHDSLMDNIDLRKGYRTEEVRIFIKTDMDLLIKWYEENKNKLHPLVLAGIFHHKFEKIHPFMDGNGRTGRMLINWILLSNNYPPLVIRKKNRTKYLSALNKADAVNLTKISELYNPLIEVISIEYYENYWNIFL